ncbi:hypothetical protein E2320_000849 [Naja naja]|nr:hypothetical protein E2320_000849 [Naja naja]
MAAEVRLKKLEELVLDRSAVGLETLVDLLLCVHHELSTSPLAQEKYITEFLQWEEMADRYHDHVEKVVDLLNQAALIVNESKITILKQVQELIINKDPTLLDNFLDEIIAFQADNKRDTELLLKLIANLNMLLRDENVNWMVKSRVINEMQEACWEMVSAMANEIIQLLDSDNDGIRTHAIKFVEGLIITLSPCRIGGAQATRE